MSFLLEHLSVLVWLLLSKQLDERAQILLKNLLDEATAEVLEFLPKVYISFCLEKQKQEK